MRKMILRGKAKAFLQTIRDWMVKKNLHFEADLEMKNPHEYDGCNEIGIRHIQISLPKEAAFAVFLHMCRAWSKRDIKGQTPAQVIAALWDIYIPPAEQARNWGGLEYIPRFTMEGNGRCSYTTCSGEVEVSVRKDWKNTSWWTAKESLYVVEFTRHKDGYSYYRGALFLNVLASALANLEQGPNL